MNDRPTVRDLFAAAALVGLIANPKNQGGSRILTQLAFVIAEDMMKAREKTGSKDSDRSPKAAHIES